MSFLKSKKGLVTSVVAILVVFLVAGVSCSSSRFTRPSACTVCHEVFEDPAEYMPMGELSESVEDFRPTRLFEPKAFDMSVGCAECHAYPFEEYKESPHYDNDLGVRPGCVGCHDPHGLGQFLHFKFLYLNNGRYGKSPFDAISNSLRDIPEWEELRIKLAKRVREKMVAEKSAKCMVCHKIESEWWNDIERHKAALPLINKGEKSCIHCHYNLVHADVDWPELEQGD